MTQKERSTRYYKKHTECIKNKVHKYYLKNKAEINVRHRKYNKIQYEQAKLIMKQLKINGCAICGYNKYIVCLDFHHTNPKDKKFTLNKRDLARKDNLIVDELNKCILLCKNCHYGIHFGGD